MLINRVGSTAHSNEFDAKHQAPWAMAFQDRDELVPFGGLASSPPLEVERGLR